MLPYLTVNLNSISYFTPNSRKRTPSRDTSSHSASKEIPHHLQNPEANYHAHMSPSLVPRLSQIDWVHILRHSVNNCPVDVQYLAMVAAQPVKLGDKASQLIHDYFVASRRLRSHCLPVGAVSTMW